MTAQWQYRVVEDDPDAEWHDVTLKQPYISCYAAARWVSERHYCDVGGAGEWPSETGVAVEIRAPDGAVTKHEIWWEATTDHLSRQVQP